MRRLDPRLKVRHLLIMLAVAAAGFCVLRATSDGADEILIRQYSGNGPPRNRGHALRVRLNNDRLRANGLSREDVNRALEPSRMLDPDRPEPPPTPGVVFVTRPLRPDQCENIVLKADAEGTILRLKDVAKVEVGW